ARERVLARIISRIAVDRGGARRGRVAPRREVARRVAEARHCRRSRDTRAAELAVEAVRPAGSRAARAARHVVLARDLHALAARAVRVLGAATALTRRRAPSPCRVAPARGARAGRDRRGAACCDAYTGAAAQGKPVATDERARAVDACGLAISDARAAVATRRTVVRAGRRVDARVRAHRGRRRRTGRDAGERAARAAAERRAPGARVPAAPAARRAGGVDAAVGARKETGGADGDGGPCIRGSRRSAVLRRGAASAVGAPVRAGAGRKAVQSRDDGTRAKHHSGNRSGRESSERMHDPIFLRTNRECEPGVDGLACARQTAATYPPSPLLRPSFAALSPSEPTHE